jgi:hypothetical protein
VSRPIEYSDSGGWVSVDGHKIEREAGRYIVGNDGMARKAERDTTNEMNGCDLVLQGVAAEFEKPFLHKTDILILKSGCFDKSLLTLGCKLKSNHDTDSGISMRNRLQVYASEKSLCFRVYLPQYDVVDELSDFADVIENYSAVSIGHIPSKAEATTLDGIDVILIHESDLTDISILSDGEPAVKSSYAYVAALSGCNDLKHDCDAGIFEMRGKAIGLHRKITANESGDPIKYRNRLSAMDLAAAKFTRLLAKLA